MGLEEPSTSEIIRDIQSEVQAIRAAQDAFVVRALHDAELVRVKERLSALENRNAESKRMWVSAFALPLLVVLVAYLLGVRP